jgi:hypothetical protein
MRPAAVPGSVMRIALAVRWPPAGIDRICQETLHDPVSSLLRDDYAVDFVHWPALARSLLTIACNIAPMSGLSKRARTQGI